MFTHRRRARSEVCPSRLVSLTAAAALTLGCVAPPGYHFQRNVAFDGTQKQIARWTCGHTDIVLTERDGKRVMHDLNNDLVVEGKRQGRLQFYSGSAKAGDAPTGQHRWDAVVDPENLTQPIQLKEALLTETYYGIGGEYVVWTLSCPRAPRVELIR